MPTDAKDWSKYLKDAELNQVGEDHPYCGTPDCCGQCDQITQTKTPKKDEKPEKQLLTFLSTVVEYMYKLRERGNDYVE